MSVTFLSKSKWNPSCLGMSSSLCSFWKNSCLVLWSAKAMSCHELSFSSLGDTCADLVPLLSREELCLTSWLLQRCHLKSSPVPRGPGEAFLPQCPAHRGHMEQQGWLFCSSGTAALIFHSFWAGRWPGLRAEPAPLPQRSPRSQDQEPRCRARANAYFGKISWCLSRQNCSILQLPSGPA